MRLRKRTETTIETCEVWIIKRTDSTRVVVCHECLDGPTMLTPDDAALLTGVSTRLIYRWVEAGRIHFYESEGGELLVCLAPLSSKFTAFLQRRPMHKDFRREVRMFKFASASRALRRLWLS